MTYGPEFGPRVEWQNQVLLEALQASQGLIGPSVLGLAIEAGYDLVVLHACVSFEHAEDLEDLKELAADLSDALESYTSPAPAVELRVQVGETDQSWSGYQQRRLYLVNWRIRGPEGNH